MRRVRNAFLSITISVPLGAGFLPVFSGAVACRPTLADQADRVQTLQSPTIHQKEPILRVGLNRHLSRVVRESTYPVDLSAVLDNTLKIISDPVTVVFDDPAGPALGFEMPTSRFVSLDQAGGWVYGITVTPQLHATSLEETLQTAHALERRLTETSWHRDASWSTSDSAAAAWARSPGQALSVARFTAGTAELRVTIKRTGTPTPSERIRGARQEKYFVNVDITDFSRLDRYEAYVDQRRRATNGNAVRPLPVAAFMSDTNPP